MISAKFWPNSLSPNVSTMLFRHELIDVASNAYMMNQIDNMK